ncbi:hypothetical protein B0A53_01320 [Rhodotorula sp. CCFEE 5036]|nr:hypothetical protein B0A53_01320 [Rhodotorula sp. CCFEE 5036]
MPNPPKWAPLPPLPPLSPSEQRSQAQAGVRRQLKRGTAPGEAETVVASASAGVPTKESAQSTELSRERSTTTRTVEDEGRRNKLSAAEEKASSGVQALLIDDGEQTVQPLHVGKAE